MPLASQNNGGPNFSVRHLDWQAMAMRWRMAWSFFRGGVHVLNPDHAVYKITYPVTRTASLDYSSVDSEIERKATDSQWTATGEARSYLWKHDRETYEEFNDRSRRLYHLPLFRSDINNYVAGILKQPPARRGLSDQWKNWHSNVDGRGTDVDAMNRRALARALCFGRIHAVVDMPPVLEAPLSRADEQTGPAPYCYLVSPLDLVDWCFGVDGKFSWVVIRKDELDVRRAGTEMKAPLDCYLEITREYYQSWRQQAEDSDNFVREGGPVMHNAGMVPVATLWATEEDQDRVMACESPFADALDFNRHQLNKLSELDETERMQTFSVLAWPTPEGAPLGELDIGQFRACSYDAQAGAPSFISPDGSLADGKWGRIESQTQLSRTLEGTSRGRAEYSKEERSAASIAVENEDKRNRMAWWASSMQEFDLELHQIVAKFLGTEPPPDPAYVKEFDFRAISSQIADIGQLKNAGLPKKTIFALSKGPVEKMLRENGLDQEEIDQQLADIDSEAEDDEGWDEKPAPAFGGFAAKVEDRTGDDGDGGRERGGNVPS